MKWRGVRHRLVTELKESGTQPKIVSDRDGNDGEVWKRKGSEKASGKRRGVEIGCGVQRAYVPGSEDELFYVQQY